MTLNKVLSRRQPNPLFLCCFVTFVDFIFQNHVFLQEVSPKRVKSHSSEKVMKKGVLSGVISLKRVL